MIEDRKNARINRDFKKADDIRKSIEDKGYILEDTKDGTIAKRK
jgi:cysteinyl-tRNA synthetase